MAELPRSQISIEMSPLQVMHILNPDYSGDTAFNRFITYHILHILNDPLPDDADAKQQALQLIADLPVLKEILFKLTIQSEHQNPAYMETIAFIEGTICGAHLVINRYRV